MNMSGSVRVRTDRRHKLLYNDLRNFVAKEAHEIFFICACVGFRENQKASLGKNGDDRFWSSTITPEEYASYYAMMIESRGMDFSSIIDDKAVLAEMEEYANAGIKLLIDEILGEYVLDRGDEIRIDPTCSKELPKVMLAYIYEKTGD